MQRDLQVCPKLLQCAKDARVLASNLLTSSSTATLAGMTTLLSNNFENMSGFDSTWILEHTWAKLCDEALAERITNDVLNLLPTVKAPKDYAQCLADIDSFRTTLMVSRANSTCKGRVDSVHKCVKDMQGGVAPRLLAADGGDFWTKVLAGSLHFFRFPLTPTAKSPLFSGRAALTKHIEDLKLRTDKSLDVSVHEIEILKPFWNTFSGDQENLVTCKRYIMHIMFGSYGDDCLVCNVLHRLYFLL
jgi:hypothetical protein